MSKPQALGDKEGGNEGVELKKPQLLQAAEDLLEWEDKM